MSLQMTTTTTMMIISKTRYDRLDAGYKEYEIQMTAVLEKQNVTVIKICPVRERRLCID